ncbi:MAG: DJ-1/PfpI family protein [Sedimentisphaerales bacterium]|nr:DJ-1/PfpI family protein [Sedimentisphaerales bacterium]
MKGRTILTACRGPFLRSTRLILVVLLSLASLGSEQAPPSEGRRAPRTGRARTIQLPKPSQSTGVSVEQALLRLLNLTPPAEQRLQPEQIGQLLWAGQGVALPQAGEKAAIDQLPAIRLYVALPDGLYLYYPGPHALQQAGEGDVRASLATAALNQPTAGPIGGCQIVLAGASRDFSARFGTKGRNAMLLQAGQMAQSIQLEAVCRDLTFVAAGNFDAGAVRRTCRLPRELEPLYVLMVGVPASRGTDVVQPQPGQGPPKRAVLIVPQNGFQDQELFDTKRGLELASVQTVIASTRIGPVTGAAGGVAEAELLVNRVAVENFDAIVFIGGPGTVSLVNNRIVLDLAQRAANLRRVIAASGNAPTILANAGIISGARVTSLLAQRDMLLLAGGIWTGAPVEKDGPLVTSAGPQVVPQFVMAILDALSGQ